MSIHNVLHKLANANWNLLDPGSGVALSVDQTGIYNIVTGASGETNTLGAPLKEGVIRFVPVDGQTPTADAPIVNGRFSATVPVGKKRVEISAPRVVGKRKMYDTPDSPVVDDVAELLLFTGERVEVGFDPADQLAQPLNLLVRGVGSLGAHSSGTSQESRQPQKDLHRFPMRRHRHHGGKASDQGTYGNTAKPRNQPPHQCPRACQPSGCFDADVPAIVLPS